MKIWVRQLWTQVGNLCISRMFVCVCAVSLSLSLSLSLSPSPSPSPSVCLSVSVSVSVSVFASVCLSVWLVGWLVGCVSSFFGELQWNRQGVQLERLGRFRVCSLPERRIALQCLSAWRPKFCTPAKPSKRQRVPDAVLAAAAAEAAARKEAMQKASVDFARFALEEPLLMVCACDRWERVLALDLQEAWQSTDFVNVSVEEIAPALFRIRGPVPPMPATPNQAPATEDQKEKIQILPEGTFDRECVWHAAGIRRCLQLLTLPLKPAEVIEAAAKLNFPDGWSLEHEGPHPVRYESLAPFTQSSSFLAAGLGRVISGPIRPSPDETDRHASARLVTVEMINSEGLHFLAKDSLGRQSFNPTAFGSIWRSRPFPDYSAALEPLAALALLGIGLRVHHRLGREPRAFLDATCGTGTVAAAAKYCVSAWPIFAGDVNVTMSKRSLANLAAAFPGQAYELLDEPPPTDPLPGIGVRHWDATNPWPIPARAGLGEGGEGLLVASNLPWGKSLDTQVEAATQVARTLSATLPRATMCLIAPEEVGRNCSDWFKLLHTAPVGKKAALIVGHGLESKKSWVGTFSHSAGVHNSVLEASSIVFSCCNLRPKTP